MFILNYSRNTQKTYFMIMTCLIIFLLSKRMFPFGIALFWGFCLLVCFLTYILIFKINIKCNFYKCAFILNHQEKYRESNEIPITDIKL